MTGVSRPLESVLFRRVAVDASPEEEEERSSSF